MDHRAFFGFFAVLLVGAGCGRSTGPYGEVRTRLEVGSVEVSIGEVLPLRAIATNHGDDSVEFIVGCGPGLDFEVQLPTGERRFPARDLPSICPIFDSNILEPGETDSVSFAWTVPGPTGTYRMWAGGRVPGRLAARSKPVDIVVVD